jgi:bile acid:Na+ symporter, BASS family
MPVVAKRGVVDRAGSLRPRHVILLGGVICLITAAAAGILGPWPRIAGAGATLGLACAAIAVQLSSRWRGLGLTIWVCAFACAALFFPSAFVSWGGFELRRLIVPLIQVVMFGMGTTLALEDFRRITRMPAGVLIGIALQFSIMPLAGWTFARAYNLDPAVAAGLILVGSCPGGVSSNVITYLAGANVALSVTMTASATLMSPLITPFAMAMLSGRYVPVEIQPMAISIVYMTLLPVLAGLFVSRYAAGLTQRLRRGMPWVSMLAICIIIAVTIALSRDDLLVVGPAVVAASASHNAFGYFLGYTASRILGLTRTDSRTVAIEVGMQNGGMATGLAFDVLRSERAAMVAAVFGPWSAIAGSALASVWRRRPVE